MQNGVAGQTRHRTQLGLLVDPLHHFRRGKVAVAAKDDQGVGPGVPEPLDHALQHREPLRAAEARGLEDRGEQASREPLIQVERQETLPAIIAIVAGVLLLTMDAVLGVIDIAHDDRGCPGIGGDTLLQQHQRHAGEFGACDAVFKP